MVCREMRESHQLTDEGANLGLSVVGCLEAYFFYLSKHRLCPVKCAAMDGNVRELHSDAAPHSALKVHDTFRDSWGREEKEDCLEDCYIVF